MEKERNRPSLENICSKALSAVKKYTSKEPEAVIGIEKVDGGWKVTVEALERKAVPDTQDLLGRYEMQLNKNGGLIGWKQKMIRRRADRIVETEEEQTLTQ